MDWVDLLAVQGTLKSLLQHHSSKVSILWNSAFYSPTLRPYMTTGKTIVLTRQTFVGKEKIMDSGKDNGQCLMCIRLFLIGILFEMLYMY